MPLTEIVQRCDQQGTILSLHPASCFTWVVPKYAWYVINLNPWAVSVAYTLVLHATISS